MSKENLDEKLVKAIKVARINKMIEAVVLIVFGLSLMIWSGTAIYIVCKVIAAIIAIAGIACVVGFLFRRGSIYGISAGLFGGVFAAVLGIYLFYNPEILVALGPTVVGLIIVITGIVDMTEAIRIEKQKSGGTVIAMTIAAVEFIVGMLFLLHPDMLNSILFILMGASLVLDGIADIWVFFQIGKPEKVVQDAAAAAAAPQGEVIDGDVRPLNEEGGTAPEKEQSFVERAKARAAARKQGRDAGKAAQAAEEKAPEQETKSSDPVEGYTTIPHVSEENAQEIPPQ